MKTLDFSPLPILLQSSHLSHTSSPFPQQIISLLPFSTIEMNKKNLGPPQFFLKEHKLVAMSKSWMDLSHRTN